MTQNPTLWRLTWSHACGVHWQAQRQVTADSAEAWRNLFQADDPGATFRVSVKAPPITAGDEERARHPAYM